MRYPWKRKIERTKKMRKTKKGIEFNKKEKETLRYYLTGVIFQKKLEIMDTVTMCKKNLISKKEAEKRIEILGTIKKICESDLENIIKGNWKIN